MVDPLQLVDDLLSRTQKNRLLIIVGAGISLDAPACAPSPKGIISGALRPLTGSADISAALSDDPLTRNLVNKPLPQMLPESFYSSIESTLDYPLHHHVWKPLAKTGLDDGIFNENHETIVLLAQAKQATIITPNYDSHLEAACEAWCVPYQVIHNDELHKLSQPQASRCIRIIKIHGDAKRIPTIVSREADLLRLFDALTPLNGVFTDAFIAGYSGRDLDLFPWLVSSSSITRALWVEPYFHSEHRGLRLSPQIDCSMIELTLSQIREHLESVGFIKSNSSRVTEKAVHPRIETQCERIAESLVSKVLDTLPHEARYLALASALSSIGYHKSSYKLLKIARRTSKDRVLNDRIDLLAILNLASIDRFASAYKLAAYLASQGIRRFRYQARVMREFCLQQYYLQRIKFSKPSTQRQAIYGNVSSLHRLPICALRQFIFLTALAPYGINAVIQAAKAPVNSRSQFYDDACAYLEHLIRSYAYLQYVTPSTVNVGILKRLDNWCHRVGYLIGAIHTEKYASRHDRVDIVATGGVFGRLNVLEDALSYAIIKRDEATYQLSHATTLEQKQKTKNDAISQGLRLAQDSGSAAIEYALYRLKFIYNIEDADDLRAMDMAAETVEVYDTRKDSLTLYYKPLELLERLLSGRH